MNDIDQKVEKAHELSKAVVGCLNAGLTHAEIVRVTKATLEKNRIATAMNQIGEIVRERLNKGT